MSKATDIGMNRTGIQIAAAEARRAVEGAQQSEPSAPGDHTDGDLVREPYIKAGTPIGTMPLPSSVRSAVKTAAKLLKGEKASVLLDRLGERIQFERTGTRLYEMVIAKVEALPNTSSVPPLAKLHEHREEELRHFYLLHDAITSLGGDPTVVTPCADVTAVESLGLVQVISDPRVDLAQTLHALLVAEATDNEGWPLLTELAEAFDQSEMAAEFRVAQQNEEKHLVRVRGWLAMLVSQDAGVELPIMLPAVGEGEVSAEELIALGEELVSEGSRRLSEK